MSWLLRLLDRSNELSIPWAEIEDVTHAVKLKSRASELGLAKDDARLQPWLEKGAAFLMRLSNVLGRLVVTESGWPLGKARDRSVRRATSESRRPTGRRRQSLFWSRRAVHAARSSAGARGAGKRPSTG
jgi:hypothetical protein